jgi:hypothetical protein
MILNTSIALRIRSRKPIAAGFAVLLVLSHLCLGCTKKEDKSTHYLKMVGSCNQQTSVKIFDETGGIDSYDRIVYTIDNQYFKTYVSRISKHIFTKIDKMGLCRANTSEDQQVELVFVYRPAISRGIAPYNDSPTKLWERKFWDNRYLDSPWVKFALDKSSQHNMRGIFVWNERQFILDQAAIKTKQISDTKPLLPIDLETFHQWAAEYRSAEYKERDNIAKQLQLPADMVWLFKYVHSNPLGGGPREASISSLRTVTHGENFGYTDLIKGILDRFFAESKADTRYDSILDLQDVFNLDLYRTHPYTDEKSFKHYKSLP